MTKHTEKKRDQQFIKRIQKHAPEVLQASVPEGEFDDTLDRLFKLSSSDKETTHFYCRKCGEYHPKTHAHYHANPK